MLFRVVASVLFGVSECCFVIVRALNACVYLVVLCSCCVLFSFVGFVVLGVCFLFGGVLFFLFYCCVFFYVCAFWCVCGCLRLCFCLCLLVFI